MNNIIIIGVGATAKRIYRFIEMYKLFNVIGFAVDKEYSNSDEFMGLPVYCIEEMRDIVTKSDALLFIAVFWNNLNRDRKLLYERLKNEGYKFANVISPYARIRGNISGDNCWINDYVVIQSDAEIKNDVFIMDSALIGNEAVIGNHTFIAPGKIGGGAVLGEQCFVGINAVVFDDTIIGDRCIIGACTAVKRNVPDNTRCSTTSDNLMFKTYLPEVVESKLRTNHNVR